MEIWSCKIESKCFDVAHDILDPGSLALVPPCPSCTLAFQANFLLFPKHMGLFPHCCTPVHDTPSFRDNFSSFLFLKKSLISLNTQLNVTMKPSWNSPWKELLFCTLILLQLLQHRRIIYTFIFFTKLWLSFRRGTVFWITITQPVIWYILDTWHIIWLNNCMNDQINGSRYSISTYYVLSTLLDYFNSFQNPMR